MTESGVKKTTPSVVPVGLGPDVWGVTSRDGPTETSSWSMGDTSSVI